MSWMTPDRNWSLPSTPVVHVVNRVRHSNIVFGAIGSCLKKPIFECMEACNKEEFNKFLHVLKDAIKEDI